MKDTQSSKATKVFVVTKAKLFQDEIFMFVAASKKVAEIHLKSLYPSLRWIDKEAGTYQSDKEGTWLLFIREETVIS